MVKLDLDTLPTLPAAPPEAGPDRALDPPPPDRGPPAAGLPDRTVAADAEGDGARPTDSPITGSATAAARIDRLFLFDGNLLFDRDLLFDGNVLFDGNRRGLVDV
jgi:hypothetical protein